MDIQDTQAFTDGGYIEVVLIGVAIIAATFVVAEVLVRWFRKAYRKTMSGERAGSIFTIIIRVAVWAAGISLALKECLGTDPTVIWGALGVGGIALSLGLQGTISNLLGGLQISFSREIAIGDWVRVGSIEGKVIDITWRTATIVDDLANTHHIPNSVLNSTTVTRMPEWRRITLDVYLPYNADFEQERVHICELANDTLDASGLRHEGKTCRLVAGGADVYGMTSTLVAYVHWDTDAIAIKNLLSEPVNSYLQQRFDLASAASAQ